MIFFAVVFFAAVVLVVVVAVFFLLCLLFFAFSIYYFLLFSPTVHWPVAGVTRFPRQKPRSDVHRVQCQDTGACTSALVTIVGCKGIRHIPTRMVCILARAYKHSCIYIYIYIYVCVYIPVSVCRHLHCLLAWTRNGTR